MKKEITHWKTLLWWLDKIHTWLSWMLFAAILAIFIWYGLAKILMDYIKLGEKEGMDFIWQLILFDFILAGLMFNVKESILIKGQKIIPPVLALLFIISGVMLILGYGLMSMPPEQNGYSWYKLAGQYSFSFSMMLMSLGMSIMIVESLRKILLEFDKIIELK